MRSGFLVSSCSSSCMSLTLAYTDRYGLLLLGTKFRVQQTEAQVFDSEPHEERTESMK